MLLGYKVTLQKRRYFMIYHFIFKKEFYLSASVFIACYGFLCVFLLGLWGAAAASSSLKETKSLKETRKTLREEESFAS